MIETTNAQRAACFPCSVKLVIFISDILLNTSLIIHKIMYMLMYFDVENDIQCRNQCFYEKLATSDFFSGDRRSLQDYESATIKRNTSFTCV